MMSPESVERMREASGEVRSEDPLVSFLYQLCRDHLPVGAVESIVDDVQNEGGDEVLYTNGWLAAYAQDVANRLNINQQQTEMSEKKYRESGYLRNGCGLIAEERVRQEQQLGYEPRGDDRHTRGELREAAVSYAMAPAENDDEILGKRWPWDVTFWERESDERNLVKAGALIAAELDRLHRKFQVACNEITQRDFGFTAFDSMDAYDLEKEDWVDIAPEDFLRKHFAEDYERLKADHENALIEEEALIDESYVTEGEEDAEE